MLPLHVIMTPVGSAGDVHPFIGIGRRLRERGHRVTVIVNGYFEELVKRAGLEYVELFTAEKFRATIADRDVWHPRKGMKRILSWMMEGVEPQYEKIMEVIGEGDGDMDMDRGRVVLAGGTLAMGARLAREKHGIALVGVQLAPAVFVSVVKPSVLPGVFSPGWLPRWALSAEYWAGAKFVIEPWVKPGLNEIWVRHGLPPVRERLMHWWHSPDRVLGLFPEWFGAKQSDWPEQTLLTGFPLFDESGLDSGTKSDSNKRGEMGNGWGVVATPGSAQLYGRDFFEAVIGAGERLGKEVLVLTRFREQLPERLPGFVTHRDFVPLSEALAGGRGGGCLVHHGGIGTTSQGLRAGAVQVVCPKAHDQFDNAARLEGLGVGATVKPGRMGVSAMTGAIERAMSGVQAAETIAERMRREGDRVDEACDVIEAMAR